jgi:DNA-binding response OmpR family regulator
MALILLTDDDESLHNLLGKFLEQQGHTVIHAHDGREGIQRLFAVRPDMVILDVMMPRLDGWNTLDRIREMSKVPVILLTAKDTESDKLHGFQLGSDDYLTKPFSFAELGYRIEAILRRNAGTETPSQVLQVGDLTLDLNRHVFMRAGQVIQLTPTEFKLLQVLMRQPGRIFTQEQLVEAVWGQEYSEEIGYIRRYIWHLRIKIEPNPDEPTYIHNERGIGYKLEV